MRKALAITTVLLWTVLWIMPVQAQPPGRPDVLFQVSTLEALLAGVYDGQTSFAQLAKRGDLGLGTFNALDGEMIALDGRFYQVRADGKISLAAPGQKTPFANLVFFRPDSRLSLERPLTMAALQARLGQDLPSRNLIYALRITGRFSRVKVRSVPAQKRPYPPLTAVVKHQSVWEFRDIQGTVVGFRFPPYFKGINVSGFHLHFIDKSRTKGGHLLDAALEKAVVEVDQLYTLDLVLPRQGDFLKAGLGQDTSQAVHKVEK